MDPAIEGRVAHLDGNEQHLVKREEHRNLDDHGHAARSRIGLFPLVELHHLLVYARLVVLEALFDLHHLRLQFLHLAHGPVGFVGEREEQDLDQDRQQQDGEAEIAQEVVEVGEGVEERLGEEEIPAEVDRQVQALYLEPPEVGILQTEGKTGEFVVGIGIEELHFLGAGEEVALDFGARARRHGQAGAAIVHLVLVDILGGAMDEPGLHALLLVGHQGGEPVFVGDADPSPLGVLDDLPGVPEIVVVDLLEGAVENAERPFVEDEVAKGLGRAGARNEAIGV